MSSKVKEYLDSNNISYKIFTHPAVYTIEEAKKYSENIKGIKSKNLFLKDRSSKYFYLVIIEENKKLNISELSLNLNQKLKFANEDDLKRILHLEIGAVSPFGLINDKEKNVKIIIDKDVWNSEYVSFHPNINTETFELTGEDFQKFIKSTKNSFEFF